MTELDNIHSIISVPLRRIIHWWLSTTWSFIGIWVLRGSPCLVSCTCFVFSLLMNQKNWRWDFQCCVKGGIVSVISYTRFSLKSEVRSKQVQSKFPHLISFGHYVKRSYLITVTVTLNIEWTISINKFAKASNRATFENFIWILWMEKIPFDKILAYVTRNKMVFIQNGYRNLFSKYIWHGSLIDPELLFWSPHIKTDSNSYLAGIRCTYSWQRGRDTGRDDDLVRETSNASRGNLWPYRQS